MFSVAYKDFNCRSVKIASGHSRRINVCVELCGYRMATKGSTRGLRFRIRIFVVEVQYTTPFPWFHCWMEQVAGVAIQALALSLASVGEQRMEIARH